VVRKSSEFQQTDPSARAHFRQISSFLAHVAKEIDPVQPFLLSRIIEFIDRENGGALEGKIDNQAKDTRFRWVLVGAGWSWSSAGASSLSPLVRLLFRRSVDFVSS
jgi:hypothetical protein